MHAVNFVNYNTISCILAEWHQRIHYVVKEELSNYIIKKPHQLQPTSDFSFTKELLHGVNLRDVLHEVELLSKEVILNKTIETTANSNEHGKVYVAEVTVTSEKNELNVKIKVTSVLFIVCSFKSITRLAICTWHNAEVCNVLNKCHRF